MTEENPSPYYVEDKPKVAEAVECPASTQGGVINIQDAYTTDIFSYIIYAILLIVILYVLYMAYESFCSNQEGFLGGVFRSDPAADGFVEKTVEKLNKRQTELIGA
jgi:hypothetical protein